MYRNKSLAIRKMCFCKIIDTEHQNRCLIEKIGGGAERARGRCSEVRGGARCTAGAHGGGALSAITHAITKSATVAPTSKM